MNIKDPLFYEKLNVEMEELGFRPFDTSSSMDFFPIWFNEENQIYIQAISLLHFESLKDQISTLKWQQKVLQYRTQWDNFFCMWEDTWFLRRAFIKSHIHYLSKGNQSVFARDLKVGIIPEIIAKSFLNEMHILGEANGKVYLGLFVPPHRHFRGMTSPHEFNSNPLMAVAVFGKTLLMKDEKYVGQKSAELVRFASIPGIRIVGGVTKALSFYQKEYSIDNVMTYVDLEWNNGKGFLGMGFHLESMTNPLMFKIDDAFNRSLVDNWSNANACNAGNLKLRYLLK